MIINDGEIECINRWVLARVSFRISII